MDKRAETAVYRGNLSMGLFQKWPTLSCIAEVFLLINCKDPYLFEAK